MGAVYLGTRADEAFSKQVAIKIVAAPLGDEDLIRRFRRERQILAELEHPGIARLIDGGATEEGLPYLVMEYVDGVRLDEFFRARRLPVPERLRLFTNVCDAVQYAHGNLVVHRDLKPQNIFVTPEGHPKLLDFGIASLVTGNGDGVSAVTRTGIAAMTPEYASPEQIRGDRVTAASDIYSLGVILYELLSGVRPHDLSGKRPDEIYRAVSDTDPARPSAAAARAGDAPLARRLRGDLDAIVLTALRKEPHRRYASVAQLSDDVRRYLDGHPVSARGEAVSYRAWTFVRRHRLGVAAAALLLLTLVGGIVATTRQARIAEAERREAERQRVRAERRFADVRQLANAFLFDFHDAIANLPGSTPARSLVVSKALQYLDSLAREASGDAGLQQELATAYDKVGDVQGNPSTANLGNAEGALESYRKALEIRRALAAADSENLDAQVALATSAMKIGDALVGRGAVKDAVAQYQQALDPRERALAKQVPSAAVAHRAVVETTGRLCTTLLATGDPAGALANCTRSREVADALLAVDPGDPVMRGHRASNSIALGNALRVTGKTKEAEAAFEDGIRRSQDLLTQSPANAEIRRRLAVAYGYLANAQVDQQRFDAAAISLEQAIDELSRLAAADPANVRSTPELAFWLNRRAGILLRVNRRDEARRDNARALGLLRVMTERPGAGGEAFNEYAWALVSYEPADLRNPSLALTHARRAVDLAGQKNPVYLHTLAWAHHRLGQQDAAVKTLQQALSLMPESPTGAAVGLRKRIETDLAQFKSTDEGATPR
jgi:non-specific serine/threonine protein kinase/serine/threonine-protein kinase